MAKKASFNFTDDWFRSRGYVPNGKGGYDSPPFRSPLTEKPKEIIVKEKVNESPSFEVKPVTEWFIPYQIPSKKNSRINFVKNGRQISIPSKAYTEYKKVTKRYWEVFGLEFNQTIKKLGLTFPVNIELTFTRKTNQVIDFFGPGESVFDLMTDFGWWEDDSVRFGKPFFGDIIVDKNNPGTRIKLLIK